MISYIMYISSSYYLQLRKSFHLRHFHLSSQNFHLRRKKCDTFRQRSSHALAIKVFPVPGGPVSNTPRGILAPTFTKRSGACRFGGWWRKCHQSIKNWMVPYQRTPMEVARAMRYSGLGVRSVDPVGDFLEPTCHQVKCRDFLWIRYVWRNGSYWKGIPTA